ncbi:MAG: hypothetical protein O3C40_36545, partial [Planctomycetota bacterium]|nr:hypothetical protein [Planctomycetota bacterium]
MSGVFDWQSRTLGAGSISATMTPDTFVCLFFHLCFFDTFVFSRPTPHSSRKLHESETSDCCRIGGDYGRAHVS